MNEFDSRNYARKIFQLSSDGISVDNLASSYVSAGYSTEESTKYARILVARLKSEEYIKKIEDIYIEEFSAAELKRLSDILEYPVFNKFLRKKLIIQGKMMRELNRMPGNNDG